MKRYFLFGLLVLTFIASANAQKLTYGGKPKAVKVEGLTDSFCVTLANSTIVCKGKETGEDGDGKFFVRKNGQKKGEIDASLGVYGSGDNFFAFYGDLDKNKSAELVIVDFASQSNGLGVSYYDINIFPDFQTKGFQKPINFGTTEFGIDGTFVYDAKANETLILITDFNGLDNISKKEGTYFVGRFFRYQNGLLKLATDKPIYARRYLNSFEDERYRTEKNPLRPWLWLNSPKAQKVSVDTEFSVKPISSETGVVEKVETLKETTKNEDDEGKTVEIKQITVKLNSGATKMIVLRKNPEYVELDSDKGKIFPEIFGIMPATISLPKDLDVTLVFGNLEGKKVVINSYKPFEFDEDKKPRYKVLFYE
ncbi:MAG TPA: hypothetical protein PKY82_14975 [Pyrinomonadaceae bacterium]|nr:hypothetical protein [Pyrinomonadaceae bacterium]